MSESDESVNFPIVTCEWEWDSVPEEVVEYFLNKIRRNQDLLTCRLVCQQWKRIASQICRNRCVRLNSSWLEGVAAEVLADSVDPPFSSIVLPDVNKGTVEPRRIQLQMESFADYITEVIFEGLGFNWDALILVHYTGNLRKLTLSGAYPTHIPPKDLLPASLKLPKLKHLKLTGNGTGTEPISENYLEFLEYFLMQGDLKLQTLEINDLHLQSNHATHFYSIVALANISNLFFSFKYTYGSDLLNLLKSHGILQHVHGRLEHNTHDLGILVGVAHIPGMEFTLEFSPQLNYAISLGIKGQCNQLQPTAIKYKNARASATGLNFLKFKFTCDASMRYHHFLGPFNMSAPVRESSNLCLHKLVIGPLDLAIGNLYRYQFCHDEYKLETVLYMDMNACFTTESTWAKALPNLRRLTIYGIPQLNCKREELIWLEEIIIKRVPREKLLLRQLDVVFQMLSTIDFFPTLNTLEIELNSNATLPRSTTEALLTIRPMRKLILRNAIIPIDAEEALYRKHETFRQFQPLM